MELEAIGYAADLIEIAISRLRKTAELFTSETPDIENNILTVRSMFLDAWSIIDIAHNMKKVLEKFQRREEKSGGAASQQTLSFLDLAEKATALRNGMDHLSGQLRNLASKKSSSALYGALSWVWVTDFEEGSPTHARINLLTAGAFHREGEILSFVNPAGEKLETPFGMFSLDAFEKQANLSELSRRSEAVRDHYNNHVAEVWNQVAEKHAAANNISIEKIKEAAPGYAWLSLHVEFPNPQSLLLNHGPQ